MGLFFKEAIARRLGGEHIIGAELILGLPDIGQAVFRDSRPTPDVSGFYLPGFLRAGTPTTDPEWSVFVDRFIAELDEGAQRLGR